MRRPIVLFLTLSLPFAALALAAGCGSSSSSEQTVDVGAGDTGGVSDVAPDDVPPDVAAPECVADDECAARFDDLGACERARCVDGTCERSDAPNFVRCDDGDPCSVVSYCDGGECRGGLERDCDDRNPCTRDSCDPAQGGCLHAELSGVPCDDGDPCTTGDACSAGSCAGTFDPICSCDDDRDCSVREDGDLCNGTLHCDEGRCTVDSRTVVVCDTLGDDRCRPTTCDPETGTCAPTPASNGKPCEDGNLCTRGDTCQAGVCEGGANGCAACDGDAFCAPHDDGNDCNGTLVCADSECRVDPEKILRCTSDDTCVAAWCDPEAGACATRERPDGAWCDDADDCTVQSWCRDGDCEGRALDCDDGDPCTEDACATGTGCGHTPIAGEGCPTPCDDHPDCDDADPCTEDVCEASGTCSHIELPDCGCGEDADCDDLNPCTTDACDVAANTCRNVNVADDTECAAAADACHGPGLCLAGACQAGVAIVCDDEIACTTDSCDPASGCEHTPTVDCICATDGECDDGSPCTIDSCDPGTLQCAYAPAPQGTACSDDSVCTDGDVCDDAGACTPGAAIDCVDGDPCTVDACDPVAGCHHPDAPPDTPCDDGDPCTGPDTCDAGDCSPGALLCEVACGDGVDDDNDGDTDCDDEDCADDATCQVESDCRNGLDDDDDGDTDCDDADCTAVPCGPPESACRNDTDDDNDGDTDCDDADCSADAACNPEGDCRDGVDDDFDGATDCADGDCAADAYCNPETDCRNGVDDDFHGDTDCDDPDCVDDAYCHPEADCENGLDDDFHGDTDCDDDDCAAALNCVELCPATIPVACGDLVDGTNVGVASLVYDGGCSIGGGDSRGWPGGEVVYAFLADQDYSDVTIRLVEIDADHDLFVLDEACDPRSCVTAGTTSVSFAATTGDLRFIVVDGHNIQPSGAFGLSVECSGGPLTETSCINDVDDDGDGATDCGDDDCDADVACQTAFCESEQTIVCGDSIDSTNVGAPARIGLYPAPCSNISAGAPERAYAFTPATDGRVRARVTPQAGVDLDLYVLEGACEPGACTEDATTIGADTVTWDVTAGTTYYLVVDGVPGEEGPFTLDLTCGCVDDDREDNDWVGAAAPLPEGTTAGLVACGIDPDWFSFDACAGAQVTVDVLYDLGEGNIDIEVYAPDSTKMGEDYGSDESAQVTFTAIQDGLHTLNVILNPDAGFLFGNSYDVGITVDRTGCAPTLCDATAPIVCGDAFSGSTVGLADFVNDYGCTTYNESGGERVYAFTAPRAIDNAQVQVTATTAGFDPDVYVLGSSCDPDFCVTWGENGATFDMLAPGETVYIVVDGWGGTSGTFDISLTCPSPTEDCDNGVDDDDDGATDCDDLDCADAPNCIQTCTSAWTLACGDSDPWTTVAVGGPVSAIDAYIGCGGKDAAGSDYAYDVTPATDASLTVTLVSGTAGVDLDLYVLSGDCAADACVAAGTTNDDAGESVTFDAVGGTTYYLVVDGAAGEEGEYEILVECGEPTSLCTAATAISCGATLDGDNTGVDDRVFDYGCSFYQETGGEVVYAFTPTENLTGAVVTLVEPNGSVDHDLYLLQAACDTEVCENTVADAITFDATAGETVYFVVDGYQGDFGPFSLELACPGATEICGDTLDNDADGATDCDDEDCAGAAGCATCAPYAIECGFAEDYSTAGLDNVIFSYACDGAAAAGGPDAQYSITLPEARTVSLSLTPSPAGAPLDLYVLEGACDGASCLAHSATAGVETLDFVAEAGVTYYIVVDGPVGAGADYSFAATCGPASLALCEAPIPLTCDSGDVAGDNTGLPSVVDAYGCSGWAEPGGEVVYAFTPTRDVPDATAELVASTADHDLYLLDATCDAATACQASGDSSLTFDAPLGVTQYIVVDGYETGPAGTFSLRLTCPAPPLTEQDCGDGLDEDDDGSTDCEDVDCETDAACNGDCAAPTPLECDQNVLGTTAGRLGALNGYPCAFPFSDDESGAETVYRFEPQTTVTASWALLAAGWDAEILILKDGCSAADCVGYFDGDGQWIFQAGSVYYLVVDGYQGANGNYGLLFVCE